MKTFILLATSLFLASVWAQDLECGFDMSGSYDCGMLEVMTISQDREKFEIQLSSKFKGTDIIIADEKKRTANFKHNAKPVFYTASCSSLSSTLRYEMSSSDGSTIRSVELIASEDDVLLDIYASGSGSGVICSRL